jgi:hypothetical protein
MSRPEGRKGKEEEQQQEEKENEKEKEKEKEEAKEGRAYASRISRDVDGESSLFFSL